VIRHFRGSFFVEHPIKPQGFCPYSEEVVLRDGEAKTAHTRYAAAGVDLLADCQFTQYVGEYGQVVLSPQFNLHFQQNKMYGQQRNMQTLRQANETVRKGQSQNLLQ